MQADRSEENILGARLEVREMMKAEPLFWMVNLLVVFQCK
jgi:hypothetical protein